MATKLIEARKARDRQARRELIIKAARQIAESEGWPNVTVRRLSDEISYSQPVLYSHFENREGIVAAVAVKGFQELGLVLANVRERGKRASPVELVANAYLEFATASPALYEAMFSLNLSVLFGDPATPAELKFAFSQIRKLFSGDSAKTEVLAELFWASLHGIAELTRTKRLPPKRHKERLQSLIEIFSRNGTIAQVGMK